MDLFFNHHGKPTGSFPGSFMKIRLDLAVSFGFWCWDILWDVGYIGVLRDVFMTIAFKGVREIKCVSMPPKYMYTEGFPYFLHREKS